MDKLITRLIITHGACVLNCTLYSLICIITMHALKDLMVPSLPLLYPIPPFLFKAKLFELVNLFSLSLIPYPYTLTHDILLYTLQTLES
jgi:hypothetical protein